MLNQMRDVFLISGSIKSYDANFRLTSSVNEFIRTVLNPLFFLRKVFTRTKSTKNTKTQPSKSTKRK